MAKNITLFMSSTYDWAHKMGICNILRKGKMLPSPTTREECLLAGFSFAYHTRFSDYPFDAIVNLDPQMASPDIQSQLYSASTVGIALNPNPTAVNSDALKVHQLRVTQFFKAISFESKWPEDAVGAFKAARLKLKIITVAHDAWFCVGFFMFHTIAKLGFDLIALSTEEARAILSRGDVKKTTSNLIGGFEDLNWKPDKIEEFCLEKVYPFMWEPGLRKWVFDANMAIMSDLRHIATESDMKDEPSGVFERVIPAAKALIEEIPIIGKAVVVIIWGEKNK